MKKEQNLQTAETQALNIPVVSGSALIANFMYPNAKKEYESGEIEIEDGIYKKATLIFGNFDLMKYNSSWDWLMPVYRKIRDIINDRSKYDKHTRTNYDLLELDVQMAICEVNIEKAFNSTVKFIECWNASQADR